MYYPFLHLIVGFFMIGKIEFGLTWWGFVVIGTLDIFNLVAIYRVDWRSTRRNNL